VGALIAIVALAAGCGPSPEQLQAAIGATQTFEAVVQEGIRGTEQVSLPSPTVPPSPSPLPTAVPSPTARSVSLDELASALRDAGYLNENSRDQDGNPILAWTKESGWEPVTTYEDGRVELDVLSVQDRATRSEHMERKFQVLDSVFPPEFMAKLREENDAYNASVGLSASGNPDRTVPRPPDDQWHTVWAKFETREVKIGSYDVVFALWFYQVTCPSQYAYCWFTNFGHETFTGQSSFVFYTIMIDHLST
jgi:hypothetical protein